MFAQSSTLESFDAAEVYAKIIDHRAPFPSTHIIHVNAVVRPNSPVERVSKLYIVEYDKNISFNSDRAGHGDLVGHFSQPRLRLRGPASVPVSLSGREEGAIMPSSSSLVKYVMATIG
jgi:hypothetical protein